MRQMLTPQGPVDTRLFDNSHPSGMSDFARIGIRMMAHDMYDGQMNGDVVLRTLFNPEGSDNTAFTRDQRTIDIVKEWGRRDLEDDGVLNGSVYGKLIEDVWPLTDGVAIPGFANGLQFKTANTNVNELFRSFTPLNSAQGVREFEQRSGITAVELLGFSLWGHRIMDRNSTTQQIAQDALTNPQSIDFGIANFSNETRAFTQSLVNDPNATHTVGGAVLNLLNRHL